MKIQYSTLGQSLLWRADNKSAAQERPAQPAEDSLGKRLHEMRENLQRLAATNPKQVSKESAKSRLAMLKQRMEMLKGMLRFASPSQLKAIAGELKEIAKELAAVARSVGSSEGGAMAAGAAGVPVVTRSGEAAATEAGAGGETQAAQAEAAAADKVEADEAEAGGATREAAADPEADKSQPDARPAGAQKESNADLKSLLKELKKLLKELISQLKAKAGPHEKETREKISAAEKYLGEMSQALEQGANSGLYTALGGLDGGAGADGAAAAAGSGASVNVTA